MNRLRLTLAACALVSGATVAMPAAAAGIGPFDMAPVTSAELDGSRGGTALTHGAVLRLVRDQLESFDRQTGQISAVAFDTWSFEVALPLIAANLDR